MNCLHILLGQIIKRRKICKVQSAQTTESVESDYEGKYVITKTSFKYDNIYPFSSTIR